MDGFHYDDLVLEARGLRMRKGSPRTFDAAGFVHMLDRLVANTEPEIAVPVFDRSIEIARSAARIIPCTVRHLIVEGNYLLLDDSAWRGVRDRFETTVFVQAPETELRRRLEARWRDLPGAEALAKVTENDLPNAMVVNASSVPAEFLIRAVDGPAAPNPSA